ncbi:MAG TPA: DMT family transporter [Lutibacter sp.]|nr:DMT family transporter [Lutibacter sp.]
MKITPIVKGYILAIIAVLAVSNVYIFSKAALTEVSLPQFGSYWFAFGLLWILLYASYKKSFKVFKTLSKKNYLTLIFLGLFAVLSTYFFFKAIFTISNPSIVSFIGNISPALVITLSVLLLKEKFNKLEILGVLLALSGAFIISYKGNQNFGEMFINGAQYVLYGSIISSINMVIIKKNIKNIPPIILTISRTSFLLVFSLIALIFSKEALVIPTTAFKNIFIGSILGPFLTVIAGYLALQYIPLSRKAIIGSTKGLFVLVGSYMYFGNFPNSTAILGGIVSIIGVLLIAFGKMKLQKKKK